MHYGFIMATITIKDIPDSLHKALKKRSSMNRRSLNKEVISCLEEVVSPKKISVNDLLIKVRKNRESLKVKLTDEILEESKKERH